MPKSFVFIERNIDEYELQLLDGTDKAARDRKLADGWRLVKGVHPILIEQDSGGGTIDLTEVFDELKSIDEVLAYLLTKQEYLEGKVNELEIGAGADFVTRRIPVEIWSYYDKTDELRIQPEHAINLDQKYTYAWQSGNILIARFTIGAGTEVNYGNYLIRPIMNVSGHASQNPLGLASYWGAKNGFTLLGQSMWKRYDRKLYIDGNEVFGNKWFIRMSSPTWDYLEKALGVNFEKLHSNVKRPIGMAGGDCYWRKGESENNFPWNSFGGDVIHINIPVFPVD